LAHTGTDGNIFFSPFSIGTSLLMVQAGAKGYNQDQIQDALRPHNSRKVRMALDVLQVINITYFIE
jgi:serine protease inhibitor